MQTLAGNGALIAATAIMTNDRGGTAQEPPLQLKCSYMYKMLYKCIISDKDCVEGVRARILNTRDDLACLYRFDDQTIIRVLCE